MRQRQPADCCRLAPRSRCACTRVDRVKEVTVAQLDDFDEVIDVRSPSEYALDHIEGAVNVPVLNDAERERVGTMYTQVSPFEARRLGAGLVARNIAYQLETVFRDKDRHWRPLVYCWRGGGRSDSLYNVMARIGWRAGKLTGGYRSYRRTVLADLDAWPATFRFTVLCGRTGCGKSRVLRALASEGAQVLDLEAIACHRGSVLGEEPGVDQPSQKLFESKLWRQLRTLERERPVYVEAESKKVGNLQVPAALIDAIRSSPCIMLEADMQSRVDLLLDEYAHLVHSSDLLNARLRALTVHYGKQAIAGWTALATAERHSELVHTLLIQHYDPAYDRSIQRNFPRLASAPSVRLQGIGPSALRQAAQAILQHSQSELLETR